jgi:DNA polymerase-3 subunit delta'
MLEPLSDDEVARAIEMLRQDYPRPEIQSAAKQAGGSVKEALRLLEGQSSELDAEVDNLLARLPDVDWRSVHALADAVAGRDNEALYENLMAKIFAFLDHTVRDRASLGPARLKSYAEVWQKVLDAAQETEVLNLDKRPLILSIFADLAEAVRVSQQTRAPETV